METAPAYILDYRSTIMKKGYTLIELIIVLGLLVSVAAIGGLVYVAIHFIAKFW
jgi:prepilin-type N-terminal cleavage/methylation domain-containing protein